TIDDPRETVAMCYVQRKAIDKAAYAVKANLRYSARQYLDDTHFSIDYVTDKNGDTRELRIQ
ncbi:hypothetical protein BGX33_005258, partial [Mortierella sp. NVP41]